MVAATLAAMAADPVPVTVMFPYDLVAGEACELIGAFVENGRRRLELDDGVLVAAERGWDGPGR